MNNPLAGYNPEQVEDAPSFEPLEKGWYPVIVIDVELKETRSGGSMISAKCEVNSGDSRQPHPRQGKYTFMNFTWENDSEQAEKIGRSQFKAFHLACGVSVPKSLDELRFKHLEIKVTGHREYNDRVYEEITAWRAPERAPSQSAQPTPTQQTERGFSDAPAPRQSSTGPWGD
jgi:hypothetical protein